MLAFVQFDAASIEVLERMLAQDRLPVLAALKARGRWSRLGSATDLFEAGNYPTLYSGLEVADHGLSYQLIWFPEKQRLGYMDRFETPELVWERLARAGARSLVIDPYQVWRTEIGGIGITGWQFQHRINPSWSVPRTARLWATHRLGRAPLMVDVAGPRPPSLMLRIHQVLRAGPGRAADLATMVLDREQIDFLWVTMMSVHHAGHHLWDTSQVAGNLDPSERAVLEGGLEDVYQAADQALGRIVEALPPGADLFVFSPLGMGPNTTRSDLLPEMLSRVLHGPGGGGDGRSVWRFRAQVPARVRRAVNRTMPGPAVRAILARLYTRRLDWSRTRAFNIPGDHFGYLRLNLRGREREGIVDPGDAHGLLDEIEAGLGTFADEDGTPSIAGFHRAHQELSGRHAERLPDLVVRWSERPATRLRAVVSPDFGRVERLGLGSGRAGNHRDGAWLLHPPGRSGRDPGRQPQLTDLAATAAATVGAEDALPGRPLIG
jgi:predicted AlkP superfamily phosphohydrolase/phosphomutase